MDNKYSLTIRILHWLMSAIIISLIIVGFWMTSLPADYPGKFDFYKLHKSFGITALLLVCIRSVIKYNDRRKLKVPDFPLQIDNLSRVLYKVVLTLLYIAMFGMPISGYLMSSYGGHQVMWFSIPLPNLVEKNQQLGNLFWQVHSICAFLFVALISLHIIGYLKHLLWDKINLLPRIT